MITHITYEFWKDDAAQFGPDADLTNVDVEASYGAYMAAVTEALEKAYPNAEVTVQHGPGNPPITCYGDNGDEEEDEIPYIEEIVHKTWEAWDWEVSK